MKWVDDFIDGITSTHGLENLRKTEGEEELKPLDFSNIRPQEKQASSNGRQENLLHQGPHPSGGYKSGDGLPPIDESQTSRRPYRKTCKRDGSALKVVLILSIVIAVIQLFVEASFLVAIMVVVVGVEVGLCLTGLATGQSFEPSMVFFFLFSTASFALLSYCALARRPDEIMRILASVFFCIPQIMLVVSWD